MKQTNWLRLRAKTLKKLTLGITLLLISSCNINPGKNVSEVQQARDKQHLKIGGAASVYPALKTITTDYENLGNKVTFLLPNQSSGAITGIKAGLIDIGGVSRKLKPGEDNGELKYLELAKDALIVAVHPSVTGINNLTTEQLQAIYSGAITNWKDLGSSDAPIVVLDRPEDESAKLLLRKHYLGAKLKNSPKAIILPHERDLIEAMQNTPYSIGVFSRAYWLNNQIKVNSLSLDGVAATPQNIQDGKYPMVRTQGIIWLHPAKPEVQAWIDRAVSEAGTQALAKSNFIPSVLLQE